MKNFFGVGSTPVVFGDLLIVQVGGSGAEAAAAAGRLDQARPDGTAVVAFDKLQRQGEVQAGRRAGQLFQSGIWPRSAAGIGALSLLAADCWASTRAAGRSIFIFPGGRRFWRASTPQPGGRRRPGVHFRNLRPGQRAA